MVWGRINRHCLQTYTFTQQHIFAHDYVENIVLRLEICRNQRRPSNFCLVAEVKTKERSGKCGTHSQDTESCLPSVVPCNHSYFTFLLSTDYNTNAGEIAQWIRQVKFLPTEFADIAGEIGQWVNSIRRVTSATGAIGKFYKWGNVTESDWVWTLSWPAGSGKPPLWGWYLAEAPLT